MAKMRVRFDGRSSVDVRRRRAVLGVQADRIGKALADAVVEEAKQRVHVNDDPTPSRRPGTMRDSIETVNLGGGQYMATVRDDKARFENYGTRYRPAHPFWEPAIKAVSLRMAEIAKKELD